MNQSSECEACYANMFRPGGGEEGGRRGGGGGRRGRGGGRRGRRRGGISTKRMFFVSLGFCERLRRSPVRCSTCSVARTAHSHFPRATYAGHAKEKRSRREERVSEVERAGFTPRVLVVLATGGAGRLTTGFLKRLAMLMAEKSGEAYCTTIPAAWLRARLAFSGPVISHQLPQKLALKGVV